METVQVGQPTLHSRKEIATWLKQQPYSQNLNDGVLFCRILQKSYPAYFLRLHEQPRTDSDCLSNFKMLGRCLDKNGLYKITDVIVLDYLVGPICHGPRLLRVRQLAEELCRKKSVAELRKRHTAAPAKSGAGAQSHAGAGEDCCFRWQLIFEYMAWIMQRRMKAISPLPVRTYGVFCRNRRTPTLGGRTATRSTAIAIVS